MSSDGSYGMLGVYVMLGNLIADECGRYGLSFMWKATYGVSSADYRVHLVSV